MYYLVILQESYNGDKFCLNRAKRNKIWINFNQITKRSRTSSVWPVTIHTQTNDKWHSKSAMTRKENKEIQSKDIHSGHTWATQVKLVQLFLFRLFPSLLLSLKNSFSHNLSFPLFHTFSRICLLSFPLPESFSQLSLKPLNVRKLAYHTKLPFLCSAQPL